MESITESITVKAIGLETQPVALLWADEVPARAVRFKPGRWGCVVNLFAVAATRGRAGAFYRQTFGCWGGGFGLGFGNQYEDFPGGLDCFCRFLSSGNEKSEEGRAIADQIKVSGGGRTADDFLHGERYIKDPESTRRFVQALPMQDILAGFAVVKPLEQTDPEHEDVKSVTFFVDPDRLSALVILANYARPEAENVIVPWAAGCQVMGIYAYRELERDHPTLAWQLPIRRGGSTETPAVGVNCGGGSGRPGAVGFRRTMLGTPSRECPWSCRQ